MRLGSNLLLLLALGLSASSRAASISDEASLNNTQSTPGNPRSGSVSDLIDATFDLGEDWSLLAGALMTIEESTPAPPDTAFDVTVSGNYYGYRQDPTQIGFFSLGSTGRMQINGGSGVPIAPLRYFVRPEVVHRMGDLSFRLWVQAGRYVEGAGQTTRGVGARLQYKLTKAFKMWAAASGQRDVDSEGNLSLSSTFSLGFGYKF